MQKHIDKLKVKTHQALRWSEKYTKTDMVYAAKGGFWITVGQAFVSLSIFLLSIAFANFIPKEIYGQYKYILSIVSALGIITLSGLGTALTRAISRGYDGSLKYAFWLNIKWNALFVLGAAALSVYYFIQQNTAMAISLLIAGSLSPVLNSANLFASLLAGKKDFKRQSLYSNIFGRFFFFVCMLATILLTQNPVFLILTYFLASTVTGLFFYFRTINLYKPNDDVDPELKSHVFHLSAMGILTGIAANIDQILVFHYIGAAELAIYNFAIAIPEQLKGPMKSIDSLIFPKFAVRKTSEIKAGMGRKVFWLAAASLAIIVAYIIAAPFVYKIFFPKYMEAVKYSQIFITSLVVMAFIPMNTYLTAKKKIKELYVYNVITNVTQIIVIPISIIMGGLMGLIIGRVALRIFGMLIITYLYTTSTNESVEPS